MSRKSVPARNAPARNAPTRCVVDSGFYRQRPSMPDALVIVVIAVLACGLSASGLGLSSVLAVLGSAGAVSAGTLVALRGGRELGPMVVRVVHAITAP